MHNHHNHFYDAPKPEASNVDLMSALDSIENYRRIQQDTLSKATPETGEWVFDHEMFPAWRDPKGAVKTMWGSGIPGAGKTVLTSIVINSVEQSAKRQDPNICVCYIYIRYSDNAGLTVRGCLEVLVKQTLEKHPRCHKLAEGVYAEHIRLKTRPTEAELLQLLKSFATLLKAFYFLEALDEAPPEIQIDLVEKLSSTNAKLFITCRPMKALQERFPHAYPFTIAARESDLDLLIEVKLKSSLGLGKVLEKGDATLRADIVTSIKQKCGGMFLHASLQLAALHQCTSVHDVRDTLANFPPKIEDVYRHTWTRIVDQASRKGFQAQNCIIWVLSAPKSMTVAELQHAAAVCLESRKFNPNRIVHIDTLVALCRGLLAVDEKTTLVRLVHYTAKDTLKRLIIETFPRLHHLMASFCMGLLTRHGFQQWKDDGPYSFTRSFEADPLLSYAYHAWPNHARNSMNDPPTAIQVKGFVRGCRSFPVEQKPFANLDLLGPLHVAAFFNLPFALAGGPLVNILNPNCRTNRKFTPLHLACTRTSDFSTLRELLSLRLIDVNAVNEKKQTPLICAVDCGNVGAAKLLLVHRKIRLNPTDEYGFTALTRAAGDGHEALVKAILSHSPTEIHSTDGEGQTALSRACQYGRFTIVKLLLFHSQSEVRLADNKGRTPLIWAASSNCIDTFKHILSLAQDHAHLADKNGRTPLSWASSNGREEVVKILLANPGTNVNQVDHAGRTPLSLASADGVEAFEILLANPQTDVNLADTWGFTPLTWSLTANEEDTDGMRALLAHPQVNVNLPDNEGRTTLSWAVKCIAWEHVNLLIAHHDIDVNLPDRKGQTPLHWFARLRPVGRQPLHWFEIGCALLNHPEIDVNLVDNAGRTALSWALNQGNEAAVNLLMEHPQIQVQVEPDRGFSQLISTVMRSARDLWRR